LHFTDPGSLSADGHGSEILFTKDSVNEEQLPMKRSNQDDEEEEEEEEKASISIHNSHQDGN